MSENLFKSKRFLPLLLTQFFGALNDNLFKNALLMLVTLKMTEKADILSNVIAALFIIPFFLLSATAGEISDKYDRSRVARCLKVAEFILMLGVGVVYFFQSLPCLILLLALMGAQSAFFGPVKYALLPQQLKPSELVAGNAYVEASTYVAILLGLIVGTLLPIEGVIVLLITLSIFGVISAWNIPKAIAMRPKAVISKNIFKATVDTLKLIHSHPVVFRSILGATWFWTIGAFIAVQIYPLSGNILNVSNTVITFFLILFSVGVALGSVCCEKLMKEIIHTTYIPISTLGMGICFYCLYRFTNNYPTLEQTSDFYEFFLLPHAIGISFTLFLLAFFGGLYIVPLNALMQAKAPKAFTATVIGGNNILNALGMAGIAIAAILLLSMGLSIPQLFLIIALMSISVFFYVCKLLPDALLRSILQGIFRLFFRVHLDGIQNFQKAGKRVLLVANHTSLLDGLLIATFMPERVTFAINTDWAKKWFVKPFGLLVNLYPLDPTNPMAIRSLINEVKLDKKVMIFPEGRISVTGGLMKIYEGAGVIAQKANAKILPVRINGAQFSKFSYLKHKLKTHYFPKIHMTILEPKHFTIPENIVGREQRSYISMQLYDLMADMMYSTSKIQEHLFTSLLEAAKLHGWNHKIVEDINRKPLTYNTLIKKAYVLGKSYANQMNKEDYVGLFLPNGLANVVSFFALQSVDKVPVMLNFSQGVQQVISCIKTVKLKTVITSHQFIEMAHLEHLEEAMLKNKTRLIYLEEFSKRISLKDKWQGYKSHLVEANPKNPSEKPAVVLFTSGSEGMPKAVLLSHKNLQANRYQITSVMAFNSSDVFFNALPMFHSFGLSVGTVTPILSGIKTFFYPSPLHYRVVPELVYDTNATIVCGTDTFFYGYGRMGHPYDFFNLKYAVVGGEKLKDTTAELWMKKFGVRILEGYGATETSPVLCINTPMNVKAGTVGRLLPHITYKIKPVAGVETGGQLWVQGDNVMLGYMKFDKPGKLQPAKDHWYDTGDIVVMDEGGYIAIQGRAKRFAKIAGEMVSLTSVEQALDKLYNGAIQGIITEPDEKKGEQLVLITDHEKPTVSEIRTFFKEKGFSELWIPKHVIYMKHPPVLGTGKFDYQTAKKLLSDKKIK